MSNSVVSTLEDKESSLLSLFQPPVEEKVRSLQPLRVHYQLAGPLCQLRGPNLTEEIHSPYLLAALCVIVQ